MPGSSNTKVRENNLQKQVEVEAVSNPELKKKPGTSERFPGSCPFCQKVFEDQDFLETHASTCDGPIHTD